jgi:transcriptional regulator
MYVPGHFAPADADVRELLDRHGAADLVTSTERGLVATFLPFVHDAAVGEHGALLGHVARPNEQWQLSTPDEALVIVRGPDAYVSPNWYPSKAEHGRAVPTWNYVTAHVYGRLIVHDDPAWLANLLPRLTEKYEGTRPEPWSVQDAPPRYVAGLMRAIVGLEVRISRIEAKAKLSQNRSDADVEGVIAGLLADGDAVSADAVAQARSRRA